MFNRGKVIRGGFQRVATAAEGVGEKEDRVRVLFEEDIKGEELEVGHYVAIVNFRVKHIIVTLDIFITQLRALGRVDLMSSWSRLCWVGQSATNSFFGKAIPLGKTKNHPYVFPPVFTGFDVVLLQGLVTKSEQCHVNAPIQFL